MIQRLTTTLCGLVLAISLCFPVAAWAAEDDAGSSGDTEVTEATEITEATEDAETTEGSESTESGVTVSDEGEAAYADGAAFALSDFSRAQSGSNRAVDDTYIGYRYYQGKTDDYVVAVATENFVLVYVPADVADDISLDDEETQAVLQSTFIALDEAALNGGIIMTDDVPWYFTTETRYVVDGVAYEFAIARSDDSYYVAVLGEDGSDITGDADLSSYLPTHVDFAHVSDPSEVDIVLPATGFAAFVEFLGSIDMSPLWVTLRTTSVAIVFIFVLGLAAAYFSLRLPKRVQDVADAIFTIPMVLPPTVCGFLLLLALGNKSPIGEWFSSIGFRLVFSWPATVIAAVVVAFPLMYRSARGAFEGLDPNMLDAARTLGWSNRRIFFKLMMPLAWSSIAAGTVLAFARALGEFGATLFVAGNYVGITRTIPIAIYFEWMSGNSDVAMFWAVVIIVFSFIVILFINLWGRRTTKYRRRSDQ